MIYSVGFSANQYKHYQIARTSKVNFGRVDQKLYQKGEPVGKTEILDKKSGKSVEVVITRETARKNGVKPEHQSSCKNTSLEKYRVYKGNKMIGLMEIDFENPDTVYLGLIDTREGNGDYKYIGTRLIQAAVERSKQEGCSKGILVDADRAPGQTEGPYSNTRFTKFGFKKHPDADPMDRPLTMVLTPKMMQNKRIDLKVMQKTWNEQVRNKKTAILDETK